MSGGIQKKVLTDQTLYYGNILMPKGFEIDQNKLVKDNLQSILTNSKFHFSKPLQLLDAYIREHIYLEYDLSLVNKNFWGNFYKPQETTTPLLNVNPVDLKNSADFTLLYGIKVKDCSVKIYYDHNRRKGRSWDIPLTNNQFIMFPSTNLYCITNKQKESVNFVETITYEYI